MDKESAWLIEVGSLCIGLCGKRIKLVTFSDSQAMRFPSKEKAEEFCKELNLKPDRIAEHMWCAPQKE